MYTSFERSVNARKQLRGKDGKWIYEGGSVKWFDAIKGLMQSGIVQDFKGDYVTIANNDGGTSRVHRTNITSIPKKASLGGNSSSNEGFSKADFEAAPLGSTATIPGEKSVGGGKAPSVTAKKQKDGNWYVSGVPGQEGDTYSNDDLVTKKAVITEEARETSETSGPKDISAWKKGKSLGGSNGAAVYTADDGEEYVVKFLKSDDHAKNEVLASRLYALAGVPTPGLELVVKDGKLGLAQPNNLGVASPMVPGVRGDLSTKLDDKVYLDKIREGFAADAWVANWDVAGLDFDNIVTDENGDPIRIDPGGSLLYRAQGTPKGADFGDSVGEWDTLRTSAQGKKVFGEMTDEQAKASAQKLSGISDAQIDEMVDSVDFDDAKSSQLKSTLKARRDDVLTRAGISPSNKNGLGRPQLPQALVDLMLGKGLPDPNAPKKTDPKNSNQILVSDLPNGYKPKKGDLVSYETKDGKFISQKWYRIDEDEPTGKSVHGKPVYKTSPLKNGKYTPVQVGLDLDQIKAIKVTEDRENELLSAPATPEVPDAPEASSASVFTVLPEDQRGASGDGYHESGPWGKFGASGIMLQAEDTGKFYIVQRGGFVKSNKGKWQLAGGATEENENPYQGAARELIEETSVEESQLAGFNHKGDVVFDNGQGWQYTNIAATTPNEFDIVADPNESDGGKWVTADELKEMRDNGELIPAFGENIDNILSAFDKNEGDSETIDIDETNANEVAEEPYDPDAYMKEKYEEHQAGNAPTGSPTYTPEQQKAFDDAKAKTQAQYPYYNPNSLNKPENEITMEDLKDLPEGSIVSQINVPYQHKVDYIKQADGKWAHTEGPYKNFPTTEEGVGSWGSKSHKLLLVSKGEGASTPEAAPVVELYDSGKKYSLSEIGDVVKVHLENAKDDDQLKTYTLEDGTRLLVDSADDENAVEVYVNDGKTHVGTFTRQDALSKDFDVSIEDAIFGGEANDPASAPRLSKDSNDLDSLSEGDVVKFGTAGDSKVYLKNSDGTWDASWLDDGHPQKTVTSDQIHAVAAYLGEDVQVMKESKASPEAPSLDDDDADSTEIFDNAIDQLEDLTAGDAVTFNGTTFIKKPNGFWKSEEGNEDLLPADILEEYGLNFSTQKSGSGAYNAKNPDLLEELNLEPDDDIADFVANTSPGDVLVFIDDEGQISTFTKKNEYGEWDFAESENEEGDDDWSDSNISNLYLAKDLAEFKPNQSGANEPAAIEPEISPAKNPALLDKLGISPNGSLEDFLENTKPGDILVLDEDNGVGGKYSMTKQLGDLWTADDGITWHTDEISKTWKPASLLDYKKNEASSEQEPLEDWEKELLEGVPDNTPSSTVPNDITVDNFSQKLDELPVGSSITLDDSGEEHVYYKDANGEWADADGSAPVSSDELDSYYFPANLKDISPGATPEPAAPSPTTVPTVVKVIDGINIDANGDQWVKDKNGNAIKVGSVVTSKAGEKGKIDYIQKGGTKVRVQTEDGNTKFWNIHLVEDTPADQFNPTVSKYEIKTDADGDQYVTTPNGEDIYVGDTVVSSGKTGFEGKVVGIKPNGQFLLVEDPADGKVKPRKLDKVSLVSSAKQAPSTPEPAATPEPEPTASGTTINDINPGEKLTGLSEEEFKKLPSDTSITIDTPSGQSYSAVKTGENDWDVLKNGTNIPFQADDEFMLMAKDKDYLTLESLGTAAPESSSDSTDATVKTMEEFEALPPGTKISQPSYSGSKIFEFVKNDEGTWDEVGSMAPPFDNVDFTTEIKDGKVTVVSTPDADSTPTATPSGPVQVKNVDELKAAPTGTKASNTAGMVYTKVADGTWLSPSGYNYESDEFQVPLENGSKIMLEVPTPTPGVEGSTVNDLQELKDAPTGTTVTMVSKTGIPENNLTFTKQDDGNWVLAGGATTINVEKFANTLGQGTLVYGDKAPGASGPIGLPSKDGKFINVGTSVNYKTALKNKTGIVSSIDMANGDVIFVDANGKKHKHKAKFLTSNADLAANAAQSALPKDPNSPWFEKPEPTKPEMPSQKGTDFAMPGLLEEISEKYKAAKGKELTDSSYIHQYDQLAKNGSSSPTTFLNVGKYGDQKDIFDFFEKRGLLSPETAKAAREHFEKVQADNKAIDDQYSVEYDKYVDDLNAWKAANGISTNGFTSPGWQPGTKASILANMQNGQQKGADAMDKITPDKSNFTAKDLHAFKLWVGSAHGPHESSNHPDYIPYAEWSDMNKELRTKGAEGLKNPSILTPAHAAVSKAIVEAINKTTLTDDITITRGGSAKNFTVPGMSGLMSLTDLKALEGSVVTDYGVFAASPGSNNGYATYGNDLKIRVRVPKGAHVGWLGGKMGVNLGENEVILPPGSRFLVHHVNPSTNEVVMDLVPDDWTPAAGVTSGPVNKANTPSGGIITSPTSPVAPSAAV